MSVEPAPDPGLRFLVDGATRIEHGMKPTLAGQVANEVAVVIGNDRIVDRVAFDPPLPLDALNNQIRPIVALDMVAGFKPACGCKALAHHIERMLPGCGDLLGGRWRCRS